jgi:tRNA nucleotidyltransferase (CCA-adding enzyme)
MTLFHNKFDFLYSDKRISTLLEIFSDPDSIFLVGGAIRDILLGKTSYDLDFCTSFTPEQIAQKLSHAEIKCIPTGIKHQTVTAIIDENLEPVEITTFHGSNMRPESGLIAGKSILEDLSFRDFRANAIALNLHTKELADPFNGLTDINNKILCCVGKPEERFQEDPLRLMRLVRLAAQLDFTIEQNTLEIARKYTSYLSRVSTERIRDELSLVLVSDRPTQGLKLLHYLGMLKIILPEVECFVGFEQNDYHKADLFDHTLEVIERSSSDLCLRLAALLHDVSKPETLSIDPITGFRHFYKHEVYGAKLSEKILSRLKYSNSIIKEVSLLVATHMRPLDAGPSGLRRLLRDTKPVYHKWRELKEADALSCKIASDEILTQLSDFDQRINTIEQESLSSPFEHLAISGQDLIELGLTPSPKFGQILKELHEIVLDDPTKNNKQFLIDLVQYKIN